ncbi:MAG: hypothetical protein CR217_01330 [Beijerinckiaceae bacterium]|nr:MAG: hypothetical protein CR217_01330 [Beijerinckiaceae bacterium]
MGFRRHGCTHEQGARPCETGNAAELEAARLLQIGGEPPEVARRLKVSRTSVWRWKQAFEANGRSDRGKRSGRGGALRKAPRYLAPAAADRRREEAIGRSARSRRLGARICHRSVDAGARGQAHREDQLQAVFGIGCVAAHQEIELFLPAAEWSREASAAAILHWKKKRRPTLKKRRQRRPNHRLHRRVRGEGTASPRSDLWRDDAASEGGQHKAQIPAALLSLIKGELPRAGELPYDVKNIAARGLCSPASLHRSASGKKGA